MQRRAGDLDQVIDRHRLRIRIHGGELRDESGALRARLAHADDAAAAHLDAGRADTLQRVEPILVAARRDHLAVELRRRVEVVVVIVEARRLEPFGLAVLQETERAARLETERLHLPHHVEDRCQVALLRPAPRGAHAEARRALFLRPPGGRDHGVDVEQRRFGDAGVIALRLRAIAAVLGTASGLDRDETRELNGIGCMMRAVHLLRAEHEVGKGQREQAQHARDGPSRWRLARRAARRAARAEGDHAFGGWHRDGFRDFVRVPEWRSAAVARSRHYNRSRVSREGGVLSNARAESFDCGAARSGWSAVALARLALPQRCELCVAPSGGALRLRRVRSRAAANRRRMPGLRAAFRARRGLRCLHPPAPAIRRERRGARLCVSDRPLAAADQVRRADRARAVGRRGARVRGRRLARASRSPRSPGACRAAAARRVTPARARVQPGARDRRPRRAGHPPAARVSTRARRRGSAAGVAAVGGTPSERPRRLRGAFRRARRAHRARRRRDDDRRHARRSRARARRGGRTVGRVLGRGAHARRTGSEDRRGPSARGCAMTAARSSPSSSSRPRSLPTRAT